MRRIVVAVFCLGATACSIGFPWPGDREVLTLTCGVAKRACSDSCERGLRKYIAARRPTAAVRQGYDICVAACVSGESDCIEHLKTERPKDWQPADAFYDACKDSCDSCENPCSAGQSASACATGDRLAKYGTTTFCP
jgi:hypothetical protein